MDISLQVQSLAPTGNLGREEKISIKVASVATEMGDEVVRLARKEGAKLGVPTASLRTTEYSVHILDLMGYKNE